MANGAITITLSGVTSVNSSGVEFQISGTTFALPGPDAGLGVGVSNLSGATGLLINVNVATLQAPTGAALSGVLTLVAVRSPQDPQLSMDEATAIPGSPVVNWTLPGGGSATQDLNQGSILLTGFGSGSWDYDDTLLDSPG